MVRSVLNITNIIDYCYTDGHANVSRFQVPGILSLQCLNAKNYLENKELVNAWCNLYAKTTGHD